GISKINRMIPGDDNFVLDAGIPFEEFEVFRHRVELIDLRNVSDFSQLNQHLEKLEKKPVYGVDKIFTLTIPKAPDVFPSSLVGLQVSAGSIAQAWPLILDKIRTFGIMKDSEYDEKQQELLAFTSVITATDKVDSDSHHYWNRFFPFTQKDLEEYIPQVTSAVEFQGVAYTYGQRLRRPIDQIQRIVEKIKTVPQSRRFVASTWDIETAYDHASPPCLVSIQFNVTNEKLYLTAYFRSNDMFAAWPKNAFALQALQKEVAVQCSLSVGDLVVFSQSAHIYEHDFAKAKEVVEKTKPRFDWTPDPNGNLVITIRSGEIYVTHVNQGSKVLEEFHGATAIEVYRFIASKSKISVVSHALDIGCELQKAEIALKMGIQYTQDKPLPIV
ncbi:MAG: thymidylate synthase, partial [Candidatus Micrarchaeota archaeon]|nr:thymidylate synthase [Candidatus Micrarchaeota archaeon]